MQQTLRREALAQTPHQRVGARALRGKSDSPYLEPGRYFTVEGHPRAEANGEVLVLAAVHRGFSHADESGRSITYENDFESAPRAVAYRPPAAPPAPGAR